MAEFSTFGAQTTNGYSTFGAQTTSEGGAVEKTIASSKITSTEVKSTEVTSKPI